MNNLKEDPKHIVQKINLQVIPMWTKCIYGYEPIKNFSNVLKSISPQQLGEK